MCCCKICFVQLKATHIHTQEENFITTSTGFPKFLRNRLPTLYNTQAFVSLWCNNFSRWGKWSKQCWKNDGPSLIGSAGIKAVHHTKLDHQPSQNKNRAKVHRTASKKWQKQQKGFFLLKMMSSDLGEWHVHVCKSSVNSPIARYCDPLEAIQLNDKVIPFTAL